MDNELKDTSLVSRRGFLKKAAYVAPTIIALGSITKPVTAAASCGIQTQCPEDRNKITPIPSPEPNESGGF